MARVRVSTTIDAYRWETVRRLLDAPASQIVDRALSALIDQLETTQERAILVASPYDGDPDVAWVAPRAPALAYDADVPSDVLRLAKQRHLRPGEERPPS